MNVDKNSRRLQVRLDGQPVDKTLTPDQLLKMYFFKVYFGGYDSYTTAPWPLYARQGFRGCMESLEFNDRGETGGVAWLSSWKQVVFDNNWYNLMLIVNLISLES